MRSSVLVVMQQLVVAMVLSGAARAEGVSRATVVGETARSIREMLTNGESVRFHVTLGAMRAAAKVLSVDDDGFTARIGPSEVTLRWSSLRDVDLYAIAATTVEEGTGKHQLLARFCLEVGLEKEAIAECRKTEALGGEAPAAGVELIRGIEEAEASERRRVAVAREAEEALRKERAKGHVVTYPAPEGIEPSGDFAVRVNGEEVFVYNAPLEPAVRDTRIYDHNGQLLVLKNTPVAAFAVFSFKGTVTVDVATTRDIRKLDVRPLSKGIQASLGGKALRFKMSESANLSVEVNGDLKRPLFIFANPVETDVPTASSSNVVYYGPGVHDAGEIVLRGNQTLYLAGGAVVRGKVVANGSSKVTIRGRGILDGSLYGAHIIFFGTMSDVLVEGIVVVDSPGWANLLWHCKNVTYRNMKLISWDTMSDGLNAMGCEDVTIDGCFLRTGDDVMCVKGGMADGTSPSSRGFLVEKCVIWVAQWGAAFKIGPETAAATISDVTYRDSDIIHVDRAISAAMGIQACHQAVISNIRYENIRVEDTKRQLLTLEMLTDGGTAGGRIENVVFKDIYVIGGPVPTSRFFGSSAERTIRGVTIENLVIHGQRATNASQARLDIGEHVHDVTFE